MDGKPPTYDELLELTRRQARQIDELRAEVERLKAELEQSRRAGKRQAAPFSKGDAQGRSQATGTQGRAPAQPSTRPAAGAGRSHHRGPAAAGVPGVPRPARRRPGHRPRPVPDRPARAQAGHHPLPLLVREWYLRLASVDFSQSRPQEFGPTVSCVGGLGFNCTLIMQSLDACWEHWDGLNREHAEDARTARELGDSPFGSEQLTAFLPVGSYASNCDPMGFHLPDLGVDGVLYNDGGGDTYFMDHLRMIFEWGGFPFCRWYSKKRRPLLCSPRYRKGLAHPEGGTATSVGRTLQNAVTKYHPCNGRPRVTRSGGIDLSDMC